MTEQDTILNTAAPDPAEMAKALEIVTNDAKEWLQKAVSMIQAGGDPNEAISALAVVEKKVGELETAISVSVEVVGALVQQRDAVIEERDRALEGLDDAFAEGHDQGSMEAVEEYFMWNDPLEEVDETELREELESREASDQGFVLSILKRGGHEDDAKELTEKIQVAKAAKDEVDEMLDQARDWYYKQGMAAAPLPESPADDDAIDELLDSDFDDDGEAIV